MQPIMVESARITPLLTSRLAFYGTAHQHRLQDLAHETSPVMRRCMEATLTRAPLFLTAV